MFFKKVRDISTAAENILRKRYYAPGENSWDDVVKRVVSNVVQDKDKCDVYKELIGNRYFIPNSPCLVNAGKPEGGLSACFVVDFPDTIEGIYKTKLDFALIARKGGGCGTTLTKIRPEGSKVAGSTHGYAAGPVKFFDTICHDMKVISQGGFREMAMMGTMSVYHPDIIKFIGAKDEEGVMTTTNISVVVDDNFMKLVKDDGRFKTFFDFERGRVYYDEYRARDIFDLIVEHSWKNGEPGLLFYDRINDSPYKYTGQEILATNPCGEQPLPPNGVCNLGSLDLSKFILGDRSGVNFEQLEFAVRLAVRFLDDVASVSSYPTAEIAQWVEENRPVGLGIMGLADYYMERGIAYGSTESVEELKTIMSFIYSVAIDESEKIGVERGIPKRCKMLPKPRRNITVLSIAPSGTISILAGCNSGIEPFFSDITQRDDKTGSYEFNLSNYARLPHFRCAVSANGAKEVTWKEHIAIQAAAQQFVDSGVSKTINFPNHTSKETIAEAFMTAWELGCKGITIYRNGSRQIEVLKPKKIKHDKCPVCGNQLIKYDGCKKCSACDFQLCSV